MPVRKAAVFTPSKTPSARRRRAVSSATAGLIETLERRSLMAADPVITEFIASNSNGLIDGNGNRPDWVELHNKGDQAINLQGWGLTDNANQPFKWTFPSTTLAAGAYMVVVADSSTGAALTTPDSLGYFHTSFSLSADGENLSLRRPDATVASQFGPNGTAYPRQSPDTSYGTSTVSGTSALVVTGAAAKAIVPTTGALDNNAWTLPGYDDSSWKSGTTGVGFDGGQNVAASLVGKWDATAGLTINSGSRVTAWASSVGGLAANALTTNSTSRPTRVLNSLNGRTVVRFDGNDDRLRVINSPLNNVGDFGVAFVFRSTGGRNAAGQWYDNAGIVDASVSGTTNNDWGTSLTSDGRVGGGTGNPDSTVYSDAGLNDGNAHVVVFSKKGTATFVSIDGGTPVAGTAPAAARTVDQIVFGGLQTNSNYFAGDLGEVRLYNTGLDDATARGLAAEMGATWGVQTAGSFNTQIGLDLKAETANAASTAAVRVPFTVADPTLISSLLLNIKYDDGFVAYLNGTEVARRNAPGGAITYLSTANGPRTDALTAPAETIDVSAFAGAIVAGNNVLAIRALNASAADGDLFVLPELVASSNLPRTVYMTTPTPGAANVPGFDGLVQTVTASVKHGFYTAPQSVTLATATPGATIVYTTDGSTPTLTNGTKILSTAAATLNIASTTVLRAVAFRDGFLPSPVTAESYMFVSDILTQPEYRPSGAYWDVGVDSDVVNNTTHLVNGTTQKPQKWTVAEALTAVPTVSLSLDPNHMFGNATTGLDRGIYTHPYDEGDAAERPVSVEYFDPNNPNPATNQFSINAGIRVTGGVSRSTSRPKKNFKLYFRADYGTGKLDYPVFGADNIQKMFDHLSLRAGHNHSWANLGGESLASGDYLRDPFARDTQKALTGHSSANAFVHLYINGQYWGMYNAAEDFDADWASANFGGGADDYDVVKPNDAGGIEADDGTLDAWNQLFGDADAAAADGTITSAEYNTLAGQVDMKALADYMLNIIYRGDRDAPVLIGSTTSPRNFVAVHNRVDPNGKFIFQTQDGELSMDDVATDRTEVFGNQNPARLYQQLRNNPDFRQVVVDEYGRLFTGTGPLTRAANIARYQNLMAKIDKAIVGESARWGNALQTYVATRDVEWVNETSYITGNFITLRDGAVKSQLRTDFPELATLAPTLSVNGQATTGGQFATNSPVTLSNLNATPAGTIYYTLDGTDPRAPGGTASTTAVAYSGFFSLPGARTVNARVLRNGVWSPLTTVSLTVAPPSLRLTELMYHPGTPVAGGPFVKDDYEYLELTNTGVTPVDLSGMRLNTGALYTVPNGTTLAAGAKGYLVKNANAFQYGYGTSRQVLGVYSDNLSNSGEQVTLFDPNSGTNVFDVTYLDAWQPTTDGGGFALKVINPGPSQAQPAVLGVAGAWQASGPGGTPGPIDTAPTKVTALTVDDGTAQRSLVRTVTVDLSRSATAAGAAAGAFTLTQAAGTPLGPVAVSVSGVTPLPGGASRLTLAFTQQGNNGPGLADGRYTLVVDGTKLTDFAGATADAAGTGVRGSQRALDLHRLSGDVDGDASVTFNDFVALQTAFGTNAGQNGYVGGADLTADGVIDFDDFVLLQSNFGKTV